MRYFLVSYIHSKGFGSTVVESYYFPSCKFIIDELKPLSTVVPIFIFEFKNREDRDEYIKDMPKLTNYDNL